MFQLNQGRMGLVGGQRFSPAKLFAGGTVQGAWYDPSDLTTLFQDSAGTTPVTAVEQPVGLMLDKSKGLTLGSELVTNGTFDTNITGWTAQSGLSSATRDTSIFTTGGLKIVANGSASSYATQTISGLTVGRQYVISTLAYTPSTNPTNNRATIGIQATSFTTAGSIAQPATNTIQTLTIRFFATSTTQTIYCSVVTADFLNFGANGAEAYFDNISVRELPGNHAYQTTSASRPTLRARYNLLERTEEFSNAYWTKNQLTVTTDAAISPNGTLTADLLTESTAASANFFIQSQTALVSGATYTFSLRCKPNGRSRLYMAGSSQAWGTGFITFNLLTGVVSPSGGSGWTGTITNLPDGWYLITATRTASASGGWLLSVFFLDNSGNVTYTGDGVSGMYYWGAQLVPTAVFPSNTYQRIGAATDYATGAAFPPYLFFDGTDDSMLTNSVDFTATDKMLVVAGVTKNADVSIIAEFSANAGTNNGAFLLATGGWATENGTYVRQSRGTATAFAQPATNSYPSPRTDVLTGTSDIAGDSVVLRVNGTQAATSATDQGAGNYGNYPLYIGSRGGASIRFNGNIYSLVIAGAAYSAGQISSTESWVAAKTPLGTI